MRSLVFVGVYIAMPCLGTLLWALLLRASNLPLIPFALTGLVVGWWSGKATIAMLRWLELV